MTDAAVVGAQDDYWGEAVTAFVVTGEAPPTRDELEAFCTATLSKFKLPKDYRFVEAIPKNASGKVLKTPFARAVGFRRAKPVESNHRFTGDKRMRIIRKRLVVCVCVSRTDGHRRAAAISHGRCRVLRGGENVGQAGKTGVVRGFLAQTLCCLCSSRSMAGAGGYVSTVLPATGEAPPDFPALLPFGPPDTAFLPHDGLQLNGVVTNTQIHFEALLGGTYNFVVVHYWRDAEALENLLPAFTPAWNKVHPGPASLARAGRGILHQSGKSLGYSLPNRPIKPSSRVGAASPAAIIPR